MDGAAEKRPLALYFHVPFCAAKCAYCDFASYPRKEKDWSLYFDALRREVNAWSTKTDIGLLRGRYLVRSVFIGGGTPTLVPAEYIAQILDGCRNIAPMAEDAEITLEGNPGTLTPQKLAVYRRAGVNRLSLGAQSFDDGLLSSLGRIHSAAQIGEAVRMARKAGFDNINLDLMYALPGQTMKQWERSLDAATALDVEHLSAYSLIVEEGTPMAGRVARGEAVLPGDDEVNAMQRLAVERLGRAGFCRYEISNYARTGRECRHNLTYWRRGDYLGLGCAAHSLMMERRFANPASLEDYLSGAERAEEERLTRQDAMDETVMLSTRMTEGLDLDAWARTFGEDFLRARGKTVERLSRGGYVECRDGRLRLTTRGMEVHNAVVLSLLEEDDDP